tara:strand:+ start:1793 stop:1942 length:150 start_codon:yes stop_codon:yes gene_type:complete
MDNEYLRSKAHKIIEESPDLPSIPKPKAKPTIPIMNEDLRKMVREMVEG